MVETKKNNILIVDDRPENLLVLESTLESPDLNIVRANSGQEALWKILEHDFALILLDVQMPEMDGFETAALIRKKESSKYIPIIFVTGISKERKNIFKGYEAGAVDYLLKPIETEVLKSKVRVFLELHEQKTLVDEQAKDLEESYKSETALNDLLHISLGDGPLEEILQALLEQIVVIPWFILKSKGSIFLTAKGTQELIMKAQCNLSAPILSECAHVPFGKCLCGRAALTREIEFASRSDHRHEVSYEGMEAHGHYCVPIMFADKVLGVLNLYVEEGHERDVKEEKLLWAVADVLAGIIHRKRVQAKLKKTQQEQLEMKDQFISHISHELRSPLTAIHQFVSIFLDGLAGDITHDQRDYMKIVLNNAEQLKSMITDLLEVSRAEAGTIVVEQEPMFLDALITETIKTQQISAEERNIRILSKLPEKLPLVYADQVRVREILNNLVGNALKFTSEGSITLSADIDKKDPKLICVSVADTGCGISPQGVKLVFERMYQEKITTEAKKVTRKGLGLGLYICKELVTRQGGEIWIESKLKQGTTFFFTLPIAEEQGTQS